MRRVVVGFVAVVTISMLLDAGGAGAEAPAELGWWTQDPLASAPEGGFAVAQTAEHPASVAAARLKLPAGDHVVTLKVPETGGKGQAVAVVWACTTTSTWHAAAAGPWAEAPVADCGRRVALARQDDPAGPEDVVTWNADVSELVVGGGEVSLMLVPGELAVPDDVPVTLPASVVPSFEVQFGPPDLTVQLAPPVDEGGGETTDTTVAPFEPETGFEELPFEELPPSAFYPEDPSFALPETPPVTVAPAVPAETPVDRAPQLTANGRRGTVRSLADALLALGLALVVGVVAGGGRWMATAGPRPTFLRRRHASL